MHIDGFCEPLVDPAIVDQVHAAARRRSKAHRNRRTGSNGKHIQPLTPGISLVYPLSGLVRCGKCKASMVPTKSGSANPSSAGDYYYRCPSAADGRCPHKRYLRGPWLWRTVVSLLRDKLFLQPDNADADPNWLPELMSEVGAALRRQFTDGKSDRSLFERELRQIQENEKGWTSSLANPQLSQLVRREIESQFEKGLHRKLEIEALLKKLDSARAGVEAAVDKSAALDRISRLHELLAGANVSDLNVELFRHIRVDSIRSRLDCHDSCDQTRCI